MKKLVALLTLLAVLTACGGGGGDRPSSADIAKALKDDGNSASALATGAGDEAIDCIAEALHDSDLSDDALQALVDGDDSFEGSKDDEKAITDIADDIGKCLTS